MADLKSGKRGFTPGRGLSGERIVDRRRRGRAYRVVREAILRGELVRPAACPQCGRSEEQVQAHHRDYRRPLDVVWLCPRCHARAHHGLEVG